VKLYSACGRHSQPYLFKRDDCLRIQFERQDGMIDECPHTDKAWALRHQDLRQSRAGWDVPGRRKKCHLYGRGSFKTASRERYESVEHGME
jgi:hypothetical protein